VGVHTSIAEGIENAAHHAHKIGCDTFQMFSANPRAWSTLDPAPEDCERFKKARASYGQSPVAIHANYLINLASSDALIRTRSTLAFRRELVRAIALAANYLIVHPGSAKQSTKAEAVHTGIQSLKKGADGMRLDGLTVLLENTAGQGATLGATFEELAHIIQEASVALPMGACIDTAHCFAAGYPIHTARGLTETVQKLESTVGLDRVFVIHANDSKTAFNSHADRHEHIGKGQIGQAALRRIVRHPKLGGKPFICETPLDRPGDDRRNIDRMRILAGVQAFGKC